MPTNEDYVLLSEEVMGRSTVKLAEDSLVIEKTAHLDDITLPYCAFANDYTTRGETVDREPWNVYNRDDLDGFLNNTPREQYGYFFSEIQTPGVTVDEYLRQRNHDAK